MGRQRGAREKHVASLRKRDSKVAHDVRTIATESYRVVLTRGSHREIANENIPGLDRIDQRDCAVFDANAKKLAALRQ